MSWYLVAAPGLWPRRGGTQRWPIRSSAESAVLHSSPSPSRPWTHTQGTVFLHAYSPSVQIHTNSMRKYTHAGLYAYLHP